MYGRLPHGPLCRYAFDNRPEDWAPEPGADEVARLADMFKDFAAPVPQIIAALEPVRLGGGAWGAGGLGSERGCVAW